MMHSRHPRLKKEGLPEARDEPLIIEDVELILFKQGSLHSILP